MMLRSKQLAMFALRGQAKDEPIAVAVFHKQIQQDEIEKWLHYKITPSICLPQVKVAVHRGNATYPSSANAGNDMVIKRPTISISVGRPL